MKSTSMSEDKEVLKITLVAVDGQSARLSLRLRGESEWLCYDGLVLTAGDAVSIYDGQAEHSITGTDAPIQFSHRPRDE